MVTGDIMKKIKEIVCGENGCDFIMKNHSDFTNNEMLVVLREHILRAHLKKGIDNEQESMVN